jgi:hypothetical protein
VRDAGAEDARVAVLICLLHVDDRHVGVQCWHERYRDAGERILDELCAGVDEAVRAAERPHRQEGQAHRAGLQPQRHHDVAVLVDLKTAVGDRAVDRRAGPEEAAVGLRDAPPAGQQSDIDVGELAAEPEVALPGG